MTENAYSHIGINNYFIFLCAREKYLDITFQLHVGFDKPSVYQVKNIFLKISVYLIFSHPPKRRRVTYASTIRPASASASTLSTSSMKPLHGIISYCTCILV